MLLLVDMPDRRIAYGERWGESSGETEILQLAEVFLQNELPRVSGPVYNHSRMKGSLSFLVLCAGCAAALCSAARADIIHLKTGRIEGKIIKRADGRVTIRTPAGIETTVDEKDILGVEKRKTPRDIYKAMADEIGKADAEGHYALAMWCRDHDLKNEMNAELTAVLKIDEDHEQARAALGHVKTDAGWLTREAAMRKKGMVLVGHKWMTKAAAAALAKKGENRRLVLAINAVVYKIHSGPKSDRKKWEEKLASFNKPALARKIMSLLSDRSVTVRRAACSSLAAMKHHDAIPRLVRRALWDSSESVRVAALDALLKLDGGRANEQFYGMIRGLKLQPITSVGEQRHVKRLYRRIAHALGELGDIHSVRWLILILYPKVAIVPREGGGGTRLGISHGGGGPGPLDATEGHVTVGAGVVQPVPRRADKYYFNEAAELALKKLTGQDLGVSPKAWQKWWNKHGIELIRKAEARRRAGKGAADELLDKAIREAANGQP